MFTFIGGDKFRLGSGVSRDSQASLRSESPDVSIGAVFNLFAAVLASKWSDSRFKSV